MIISKSRTIHPPNPLYLFLFLPPLTSNTTFYHIHTTPIPLFTSLPFRTMPRFPLPFLTALALFSPVFTSWTPAPSPTPALHQTGTLLRPIHPADLEASFGIGRRTIMNDINGIKPVDQSQFVWGASGGESNAQLVWLQCLFPLLISSLFFCFHASPFLSFCDGY